MSISTQSSIQDQKPGLVSYVKKMPVISKDIMFTTEITPAFQGMVREMQM